MTGVDLVRPLGEATGAGLVPGQVRVDADRARRVDGVAPLPGGIARADDQVSLHDLVPVRGHDPELAVMMTDGRGIDAHAGPFPPRADGQLTRPVQNVPDLLPPDEVAAVEDRHAGEVLEAGGHEVVVLADAADGRIRVKPRDNGLMLPVMRVLHCSVIRGRG
jgi:hypothetical protein